MLNKIKIPVMVLTLVLSVSLPRASYAWDDQHGRDDGHRHRPYIHNPDLTLVSGMEDIDSRVLIAGDTDQVPVEDQVPYVETVYTQPQAVNPYTGDIIIDVPNSAGGYTPIRIQKWGSGFMGPKGELYYPFPDVSQLKSMYGL